MKFTSTLAVKKFLTPSVYFQHWVAGVRGGGSGTNLFVNKEIVSDKKLIKAFFKNKIIAFEKTTPESKFYIARFIGNSNQLPDYTMHANGLNEYGNKPAKELDKFPFVLADDEAVVSYLENNDVKYLKFTNVTEKAAEAFPSAPPRH